MRYPYRCLVCGFEREHEFPMAGPIPELVTGTPHMRSPISSCTATCLHRVYTTPNHNLGPQAHHNPVTNPYTPWERSAKSTELHDV
jgi:hypothetical protein